MTNVLDRVPRKEQAKDKTWLRKMMYAETRAACEAARRRFVAEYRRPYPKAVETLEHNWERMLSFFAFPQEHWLHLRTTNIVESPFAAVRLRTTAGKRYKKVANVTALIWKVLGVAEKTFRRLDAPDLLPAVYAGAEFVDGMRVKLVPERVAA